MKLKKEDLEYFQGLLQKQLDELVVEASAGGGMVTVRMNGQKHLISVRIDREVFTSQDIERLQDLVMAAVNDANRKVDEQLASRVGNLATGLTLPGLG